MVLQWYMNSTGSFQPSCLNRTIVYRRPAQLEADVRADPLLGAVDDSQRTSSARLESKTSMSNPPTGRGTGTGARRRPSASPWCPSVHQPGEAVDGGEGGVDVLGGRRDADAVQDVVHVDSSFCYQLVSVALRSVSAIRLMRCSRPSQVALTDAICATARASCASSTGSGVRGRTGWRAPARPGRGRRGAWRRPGG